MSKWVHLNIFILFTNSLLMLILVFLTFLKTIVVTICDNGNVFFNILV